MRVQCPFWYWDDGRPDDVGMLVSFGDAGGYLEYMNSEDPIGRDIPDFDHFFDDRGIRVRLVINLSEVIGIDILDDAPTEESVKMLNDAKARYAAKESKPKTKWWSRLFGG